MFWICCYLLPLYALITFIRSTCKANRLENPWWGGHRGCSTVARGAELGTGGAQAPTKRYKVIHMALRQPSLCTNGGSLSSLLSSWCRLCIGVSIDTSGWCHTSGLNIKISVLGNIIEYYLLLFMSDISLHLNTFLINIIFLSNNHTTRGISLYR